MGNIQRILVTGANGFVGQALCRILLEKQFFVRAALRTQQQIKNFEKKYALPNLECIEIGDLTPHTDWLRALDNIQAVVHLAGLVHVPHKSSVEIIEKYQKINVRSLERLAHLALQSNVQYFIYMSTALVNGSATFGAPFSESDIPNPLTPYAKSKLDAENILHKIGQNTDLRTVILRPPLVYGKGVKANFKSLVDLVQSGLPIPLANVDNRRSFIYLENLVDAIITCMTHELSSGQTYLVSDAEPISTPQLIKEIAQALHKPARLFAVPPSFLRFLGRISGKTAMIERLLGSLVVDATKIQQELGWTPPYTLSQALQRDFGSS